MRTIYLFLAMVLLGCSTDKKKESERPYDLKIAYNVLVDADTDNYDVFVMDLDGNNKKNITNLGGVEWCYYAYEDQIYFVSDKDKEPRYFRLHKMLASGENKTKVSDLRLADSWHSSRFGDKEFVVRPHHTVDSTLYIINKKEEVVKRIKPKLKYMSDPGFSPDGSMIVFRGAHHSSKREKGFIDELYLMDLGGESITQLTQYPANDTTAMWYDYKAGPPRWNAKNDFISYQSYQQGKYSLFAVTVDGSKQWKLTQNTANEGWHDWSPDGKYLAIELFDDEQSQFHIGLMDTATQELKVLTDTTYTYQQAPVFVKVFHED